MAVIYMSGLDGGAISVDSLFGITSAAYNTGTVRTGARSIRCNPGSGSSQFFQTSTTPVSGWWHVAINLATIPTVERVIVGQIALSGLNVRITSTGTLKVYDNTTLIGTSSVALVTGQWYWVGIRVSNGTSVVYLQIDGVDQVTGTVSSTPAIQNAQWGPGGSEASAIDIFYDDIIADDTGFLAASNVNLALPISDNTVTGVTDNNGV